MWRSGRERGKGRKAAKMMMPGMLHTELLMSAYAQLVTQLLTVDRDGDRREEVARAGAGKFRLN